MEPFPHIVAICGNPTSGKSEVQKILKDLYGYEPVDDGLPMRRFAIQHLGITPRDVYSQEGKKRFTEILGKNWQHRDILGTLGNHLEAMFGPHIMPFMATRDLNPDQLYSFGSVRRDQGAFYKNLGGVVIGIERTAAPASPYEFDQFDHSLVDHWIMNNGSLMDLKHEVIHAVSRLSNPHPERLAA